MTATVQRIEDLVGAAGSHLVATVNPEFVMRARKDSEFARVLESAALCLPDGTGVVWAARRQGCELREPVAGVDLVQPLAAMCARRGFRLFLLGAAPGVAAELAATLRDANLGLEVAAHAGSPDPSDDVESVHRIHDHRAQVLLVAYGAPTQELWFDRLKDRLGVDAALDRMAVCRGRRNGCVGPAWSGSEGSPDSRGASAVWRCCRGTRSRFCGPASNIAPVLSIVVPCYNEEQRLPRTIEQIERYLDGKDVPYELILVDDGSADGTRLIMDAAAERHASVHIEALPRNRGKGRALAVGVEAAKGDEILLTDADLSTPIEELEKLQAALRNGAGVAIGSRALRASKVEVSQPLYRVLMGKTFNLIVQAVLLPGIWDTQCGFKLFRADVAHRVFAGLVTDGFGYDPEVLYRARKQGMKIAEVPVVWRNSAETKVSPISSSLDMLKHVIRIRFRR